MTKLARSWNNRKFLSTLLPFCDGMNLVNSDCDNILSKLTALQLHPPFFSQPAFRTSINYLTLSTLCRVFVHAFLLSQSYGSRFYRNSLELFDLVFHYCYEQRDSYDRLNRHANRFFDDAHYSWKELKDQTLPKACLKNRENIFGFNKIL